ncbi:MAG TPA: molybdenum cofactor biosynthesis protein MoaE [Propionibacteriaceae bacterium]|jgi:molybdopterin synthase catalytic subunit
MPAKIRQVGISESPLDVAKALGLVSGPEVGGIALFVGTVRNRDHESEVVSLDYTQHPSAVDVLTKCAEQTADQHDVLAIAVEHRVGHLEIGDIAVVVAVGAVHRGEALAACAHLINTVKAEVPIWKEQHFTSGDSEWVGLPSEDDEMRDEPLRRAQGTAWQAQGVIG